MYPHIAKIQFAMMVLVAIGGYVLGNSVNDDRIVWLSILGAVVAFVVVDRYELIELTGWMANVALLVILWFTMRDFVGGNSTAKLVSVANLVAYLQLALLFQKKTPRLCWQILVLGILQIVLAAIFNLNFERGIFFVLNFAAAIFSMGLQIDFSQWTRTQKRNTKNLRPADRLPAGSASARATQLAPLVVLSKTQANRSLRSLAVYILPWMIGSIAFAFILFHSLPHSPQEWESPSVRKFSGTGKSRTVDLDVDGIVPISNSLIFRARFYDLKTKKNIIVNGQPYFRGMALNKLVLKNNLTSWEAPYDHIYHWSYEGLDRFNSPIRSRNQVKLVGLEIILEPVSDPLLFAAMPAYQHTPNPEVEFCRDISALTRRRTKKTNTIASYLYDVATILDKLDQPLDGWPYKSFKYGRSFPEMEVGSPEFLMYTEMDSKRYPALIDIADQIASQHSAENRPELCQTLTEHFSQSNRYRYTLDYRDVAKDKSLDPVEDFVRNHRTGHCSLYASALTIMLRSQGIPARYVIGFHGGKYNSLTDCYVIHGHHAHAWVEAYIPKDQCTDKMRQQSIDGAGGTWMILDPTPAVDTVEANEALDLARSFWQDFVISPDHNKQDYNGANGFLLSNSSRTVFSPYYSYTIKAIGADRRLQIAVFAAVIGLIALASGRNRRLGFSKRPNASKLQSVRSILARAVSVVSPELGKWVSGEASESVPFYLRLERLLNKYYNLQRVPNQTHFEFAKQATDIIASQSTSRDSMLLIEQSLRAITQAFNQVRFSSFPLDKTAITDIENQIQNLENLIHNSKSEKQ